MSPQFVDFDEDGELDIVAGIFDGSPHLVRGTEQGWGEPQQILDKNGARIVLNAFWNFDTKKWDRTTKFDATDRVPASGPDGDAHATSALALDLNGDGDADLLLGDHRSGNVYRRINEGTAQQPAFATVNELVLAGGEPIDVPGKVATMRLVDWNGDGLQDLAIGSMGDPYGDGPGGGVFVYPNTGTAKIPAFGAPITLLEPSKKGAHEPTRPDAGIYMDFGDHDGDGDLDLVVGGYSYWTPKPVELSDAQEQRRDELKAAVQVAEQEMQQAIGKIEEQVKGLTAVEADAKRAELFKAASAQFATISNKRRDLAKELEPLEPGLKRTPYVWLYEQVQRGKSVGAR